MLLSSYIVPFGFAKVNDNIYRSSYPVIVIYNEPLHQFHVLHHKLGSGGLSFLSDEKFQDHDVRYFYYSLYIIIF